MAGVFVLIATAVALDVLLLPRVVMLCYQALMLFNVLFDIAMVSTTYIVLGLLLALALSCCLHVLSSDMFG